MARPPRAPLAHRVPASHLDGTTTPVIGAEPGNLRHFMDAPPPLAARAPSPGVVFPSILLTGPSGVGKSTAIAQLSADSRVGNTWVIEWGFSSSLSGELAEYPGARHQILDHDGTWRSILGQVRAASATAERNHAAGKEPDVLAIDSMTGEWKQLVAWTEVRARSSAQASALRSYDPNAPLDSGHDLWSETRDLHEELMDELSAFPGIVVLTAQAQLVPAEDRRTGRPSGRMVHRLYAEKGLEHDVSAVIRLSSPSAPWVISKCNSMRANLSPHAVGERAVPGMTLAALAFDRMGVDASARPRTVGRPHPVGRWQAPPWVGSTGIFSPDTAPRDRWVQEITNAEQDLDLEALRRLWEGAQLYRAQDLDLRTLLEEAGKRVQTEIGQEAP